MYLIFKNIKEIMFLYFKKIKEEILNDEEIYGFPQENSFINNSQIEDHIYDDANVKKLKLF